MSDNPVRTQRRGIGFFTGAGLVFLVAVAWGVVRAFLPSPPSWGPPSASALEVVASPSVSVEILPSAASLASARFEDFDVSRDAVVIVRRFGRLYDLTSGDAVLASDVQVRSAAFVGDTLAVVAEGAADIGYLDGSRLRLAGASPTDQPRLVGATDGSRLFVLRGTRDDEGARPAVVAVRPGTEPEVLTGAFEPVEVAAGDANRLVYAIGGALFQVLEPGQPALLLSLPDRGEAIVGVAVDGGATWFSTSRVVYALTDGLAVPLVSGLGGSLRAAAGALFVLDATQGRVYQIGRRDRGTP